MRNKSLLLIGGGGHCCSVLDCVLESGRYERIGIIEQAMTDRTLLSVPVVGADADLPALYADGWVSAFITLGSIGNPERRRALYEAVKTIGFEIPSIVSANATIGRDAEIGEGAFVGKKAVVNAGAKIEVCAIINTSAIVEQDCGIGAFAHISPGCILCGGVSVQEDAHIGAGAVVRQDITVGRNALVGAGSVVVGDIPANVLAYGNPCRVVRKR